MLIAAAFLGLLLLCSTQWIADAAFAVPTKGTIYFCYSIQCVADNVVALRALDPVVIGVLSYHFESDSYLAVYLGALLELFDMPEYNFVAMVLQNPPGMDAHQAAFQFVQYLPEKSIFVSVEHGRSSTGVETLQYLQVHGVLPRVIYHVNHEQPWAANRADFLNYIFGSAEELARFYGRFDLVLRNYYYAPLTSSSHYIPISPPFEGYVVGNASNTLFADAQHRLASQRSILCHFRGRVDYAKYSVEKAHATSPPVMVQSDEFYPQAMERREILRLAAENRLGGCDARASGESTASSYEAGADVKFLDRYQEYTDALAQAVFVLCPAGNNPETFRHVEALEFGAIPVMLRPTDPDRNFLRDALWADYPGPVLANWTELEGYLASMTPPKLDALQAEVKGWYARFKHSKKRAVLAQLQRVFDSPRGEVGNGAGDQEGVEELVQEAPARELKDLLFRDIPAGEYQLAVQRLLAQVLKLEARVRVLEDALVLSQEVV